MKSVSKSKSAAQKPNAAVAKVREKSPGKTKGSKQQTVLDLLQHSRGTTIPAIMKATGWQQHSVHGFLSGVVRKKLGLNVVSDTTDGVRSYRIASAGRATSSRSKTRRGAK